MNLHYETVSPLLKETLQKLVNSPIFKDFTLIGGTCLSLQLGHRRFSGHISFRIYTIHGGLPYRQN